MNLIPGQHFFTHHLIGFAHSMHVAHQPNESARKVWIVGKRPQRETISRHNHRLSFEHPLDDLPAALLPMNSHRHWLFAISVARTHNGYRKTMLTLIAMQQVFTGCLVARIGPIGIVQRCRLGDKRTRKRFTIGRSRTDKDILMRAICKELEVFFNVFGRESNEIYNNIPRLSSK